VTRAAPVAIALTLALAAARPAAADLDPRVLVLPAEGAGPPSMTSLAADVADALARGAAQTTHNVARADASLGDTAVVVGCDPSQAACLDAVAAALNVDQVVVSRLRASGNDATVEVTAVTREAEPSTRTFTVHASSRDADLAALQTAVIEMLQSGEARRSQAHREGAASQPSLPGGAHPTTVEPARPTWPILVTAGGAVLLAGGVGCWALASSKQGSIDGAPTGSAADLDRLASLESSARQYATAGNVLVVGGAVVAITGAVLWWRAWGDHDVEVTPAVAPDHAGVIVEGVW
jgi:hypothetical protein